MISVRTAIITNLLSYVTGATSDGMPLRAIFSPYVLYRRDIQEKIRRFVPFHDH